MTTIVVTKPGGIVETVRKSVQSVQAAHPGLQGPPGDGDALQIAARLSEFNTPEAKAAARANLDLETVDGGTFF